jgi:hypothetical protein
MFVKAGDEYMFSMYSSGTPGQYSGYVMARNAFLVRGRLTIANSRLSVSWDDPKDAIAAHSAFNKIATPSQPSNPGTPTPSTGDIDLLYLKNLEGNEGSTKTYKVTVPSGAKKLVVKTFEEDAFGHNLADLFVRRGSAPTVNPAPYNWAADCASVNPNRENETCTFTNPAAGDWYILVYGYHAYYATSLRVTYSK